MHLPFKILGENLKKKLNIIVFGVIMIVILFGGLWLIRFLNTIFLEVVTEVEEISGQETKIDSRLHGEVMERLKRDTETPISGIDGLGNPFRLEEQEEPAQK